MIGIKIGSTKKDDTKKDDRNQNIKHLEDFVL